MSVKNERGTFQLYFQKIVDDKTTPEYNEIDSKTLQRQINNTYQNDEGYETLRSDIEYAISTDKQYYGKTINIARYYLLLFDTVNESFLGLIFLQTVKVDGIPHAIVREMFFETKYRGNNLESSITQMLLMLETLCVTKLQITKILIDAPHPDLSQIYNKNKYFSVKKPMYGTFLGKSIHDASKSGGNHTKNPYKSSAFARTNMKHTDNKGVTRVVYVKAGKSYVKVKNAKTGKFGYRAIKS